MEQGARKYLFLALAVLVLGWTAATGEEYAGSENCAACHEEVVKAFSRTAHATAPGWDAQKACESCHGPGTAHIDGEGDVTKIVRLKTLKPEGASKVCLSCHERQPDSFKHTQSMHALASVGCVDCHDPHAPTEKHLKKPVASLCAGCHQSVASQFSLPRAHPMPEASRACVTCHDPHESNSLRMLGSSANETCAGCHFEKAGPYLYSHDAAIVEGCVACHQVHGSSNRHLLTHERQINLCYQCHAGTVTPPWHSASDFAAEKCAACHTAIHGSNTNPFFLEE